MVTLETVFVVGLYVVLLLAIFELGTLNVLKAAMIHSATAAAREAGKAVAYEPDYSAADVARVVDATLRVHHIPVISEEGEPARGVKLVLEMGRQTDSSPQTLVFGDPDLTCQTPSTPLGPDEVRVTLCVALQATPFFNSLASLGLDWGANRLQASAVTKKEGSR